MRSLKYLFNLNMRQNGRLFILFLKIIKKKFKEEEILRLEIDDRTPVFTIDLLPKVSIYLAKERKKEGIKIDKIIKGNPSP